LALLHRHVSALDYFFHGLRLKSDRAAYPHKLNLSPPNHLANRGRFTAQGFCELHHVQESSVLLQIPSVAYALHTSSFLLSFRGNFHLLLRSANSIAMPWLVAQLAPGPVLSFEVICAARCQRRVV
jgi:hypothetical protein